MSPNDGNRLSCSCAFSNRLNDPHLSEGCDVLSPSVGILLYNVQSYCFTFLTKTVAKIGVGTCHSYVSGNVWGGYQHGVLSIFTPESNAVQATPVSSMKRHTPTHR